MDLTEEEKRCSFIIRIWSEEVHAQSAQIKWRGHITHIPSNERIHFDNFDTIMQFIQSHLDQLQAD